MANECRYSPCTCTSDEQWSCLTGQWNEFDRPAEEKKQQETNEKFKEAVKGGDINEAQKLLPKIMLK